MFKINGKEIRQVTVNGKPISQVTLLNKYILWPEEIETNHLLIEDGFVLLTENNEKLEIES